MGGKGTAPERLVASKYNNHMAPAPGVKMTRLLCPFLHVAKYKRTGHSNDEANFVCAEPKK